MKDKWTKYTIIEKVRIIKKKEKRERERGSISLENPVLTESSDTNHLTDKNNLFNYSVATAAHTHKYLQVIPKTSLVFLPVFFAYFYHELKFIKRTIGYLFQEFQ